MPRKISKVKFVPDEGLDRIQMLKREGGAHGYKRNTVNLRFKRILLKLSGEIFGAGVDSNLDQEKINDLSQQIFELVNYGVEMAVLLGGGNILRGRTARLYDRVTADYMGMLATLINCLALQDALQAKGLNARVYSAKEIEGIISPFMRSKASDFMSRRGVVILGGGTGSPYFTTDTAAAVRALELKAEVLLKGTTVDGVFDSDPKTNPNAQRLPHITYTEILQKNLEVMDLSAVVLCQQHRLPILVFNALVSGNLKKIITGDGVGTLVSE
jgi:uridylate kinase